MIRNQLYKEIPLFKLQVFSDFVRHKTLTKTGRAIGMSTADVNNVILSIEKTLGGQVYLRKMDRLILTEKGDELLRVAEKVLAAMEELDLDTIKDKPQEITIASTLWDAENVFPPVLCKFKEKFPDVEVKLKVGAEYINLSNNEFDISLGLFIAKHPEIDQRFIGEADVGFFATKKYLDKFGTPSKVEEVKGHHLLVHEMIPPLPDQIYRNNFYSLVTNSYTPIVDLALTNNGLALLPTQMVLDSPNLSKSLIRVLPDFIAYRYSIFFLCRQQTEKKEMVEAIFEYVKENNSYQQK